MEWYDFVVFFFFQAEDGIRDIGVTGVQTCALPIYNAVREAMHSAFLYHAIKAGLDMGIVNAGMLEVYEEVPKELLGLVEDVLLNRRDDATERLIKFAESVKQKGKVAIVEDAWRSGTAEERLSHALVKGI